MISLAIATALAAAQAGGPPVQPRKNYGACLSAFMRDKVKDKLEAAAFTAAAKAACVKEETAFRQSLLTYDQKMGIKRREAEENASMQVDDYLTNATDNYISMTEEPKS